MQRRKETDQRKADWGRTRNPIDIARCPLINIKPPISIDGHPEFGRRAFDLFVARKFYREDKDEYGIYKDDKGCARDVQDTWMDTSSVCPRRTPEDFWKELLEMSQATYVFLSMLTYSHRPS